MNFFLDSLFQGVLGIGALFAMIAVSEYAKDGIRWFRRRRRPDDDA